MLAPLRNRNFALLWFGGLIALLGDWLLLIALPVFVYQQTSSALATGILLIASFTPMVILGSVAGVFVDRWDRRRTMMMTNLLRAPLLLLLLLIDSPETIWIAYLVAFVRSIIGQFFGPAENALLPSLVDEEDLLAANTLNALNDNLARLIGPAAGGMFLGFFGLPSVVLLNAISFVVAGVLIYFVAAPTPSKDVAAPVNAGQVIAPWAGVWREWIAGLRLVQQEQIVAAIFTVQGIAMVGQGIFNVLWVIFVQDVLQGGAEGFGWLATAQGVGGIIGGLVVARIAHAVAPAHLVALGAGSAGVIAFVTINVPSLWLAFGLTVLTGLVSIGWLASIQTLLQGCVADQYRGRIFGAYGTTLALLQLVGMGLSSTFGDQLGAVPLLNAAATTYVMAGGLAAVLLPRVIEQHRLAYTQHPTSTDTE